MRGAHNGVGPVAPASWAVRSSNGPGPASSVHAGLHDVAPPSGKRPRSPTSTLIHHRRAPGKAATTLFIRAAPRRMHARCYPRLRILPVRGARCACLHATSEATSGGGRARIHRHHPTPSLLAHASLQSFREKGGRAQRARSVNRHAFPKNSSHSRPARSLRRHACRRGRDASHSVSVLYGIAPPPGRPVSRAPARLQSRRRRTRARARYCSVAWDSRRPHPLSPHRPPLSCRIVAVYLVPARGAVRRVRARFPRLKVSIIGHMHVSFLPRPRAAAAAAAAARMHDDRSSEPTA